MFKLMKYELRKQAFSKMVILVLLALVEVYYLYAIFTKNTTTMEKSVVLFMFAAFGTILFVSFESILTYSHDLKTKCSYMLFMTPYSSYTIVGAKILSSILQIVVTSACFIALGFLDFTIAAARFHKLNEVIDIIQEMFHITVDAQDIILNVATSITGWIAVVIFSFLAITISTTLLSNKRGKGIVSFLIFLVINWGVAKINSLVIGTNIFYTRTDAFLSIFITLIFVALSYLATSYMLEEKVNL